MMQDIFTETYKLGYEALNGIFHEYYLKIHNVFLN